MDLGAASIEQFRDGADESASFPSEMPAPAADLVLEALAGAGVGTWHFDAATGLTTWDPVCREMLGFEAVTHASGGLGPVHPDDQALLQEKLERCLQAKKPYEIQFRGVKANGEIRWLHAVAGPPTVSQRGTLQVAGIVADVTARKAADEKLRQIEERHRIVQRAATDLVFEWDIEAQALSWNDAAVQWLGCRSEDLSSPAAIGNWLHPDERALLFETFSQVLGGDEASHTLEHRLQRSDGKYADVMNTIHVVRDEIGRPAQIIATMHDVTELKRADAALRESEAVNRSIIEASTDVIKLLDIRGRLKFMNDSGARALGIDAAASYYGSEWAALWPRSARAAARRAVDAARRGGIGRFTEFCPTVAGEPKWWDVVVSPVFGEQDQPSQLVAISRDITDRKQAVERLAWNASHDPLTKLANRASFHTGLQDAIARAADPTRHFALLLFDLDHFKQVNDTLGHDAGDAVLTNFATRLTQVLGDDAVLARLGGDEFAAILPNVTNGDELTVWTEAILRQMRVPFVNAGRILDCPVSVGGALFPEHGRSQEELFKNADIALYAAKSSRRGTAVVFEPQHRARAQERQSMISRARTATREEWVVPYYQPKVLLADGSVRGFEALLRWNHPDDGLQLPATIAAAFEDLDLAKALSEKMIARVIEDMRGWLDAGVTFDHVAVNAGAAEFRFDDFGESVLERLLRAGVPTSCFQLEVTETVFLGRGSECVERALKLLSAAGIRIALDDFGTGYASLRHLKQFPVDVIKIDRSFVADMVGHDGNAAIIEAVLHLGRSLKMNVVAEGIETQGQEDRLRALGCEFGQGFLYSKAVPGNSVAALLAKFKGPWSSNAMF